VSVFKLYLRGSCVYFCCDVLGVGGNKDQPVPVCAGQRHLRSGGRQVQAYSIQGLQADPPTTGQVSPTLISSLICLVNEYTVKDGQRV
jgi:hypothetical protein